VPIKELSDHDGRLALLLGLLFASRPLPGGDVSRELKLINFEERRWEIVRPSDELDQTGRPGLPHYINGLLSDDRAHSGSYSFRFDLNGDR